MSYSCCSSACLQPANPFDPVAFSPAAALSLNLSASPGSTAAGAARPFQPLASVKLASRPSEYKAQPGGDPEDLLTWGRLSPQPLLEDSGGALG